MRTKERREQQKANLKLSIAEAARNLVEAEGWESLTTRKVAEAIGYSAPTIYEFFDDKSALLYEVMEMGFGEWLEGIKKASGRSAGSEFVSLVAKATWKFAFAKKELYLLMHALPDIPFGTERAPKNAQAVYQHIYDGLKRGRIDSGHSEVAVEMIWATMHGWISLTHMGRIQGGRKRAEGLFFESVEMLSRTLFR